MKKYILSPVYIFLLIACCFTNSSFKGPELWRTKFSIAILPSATINYYLNDPSMTDFDKFVFYPKLENSHKWADHYILVAYAVNTSGKTLNKDILLKESDGKPVKIEEGVLNLGHYELTKKYLTDPKHTYDPKLGDLLFTPVVKNNDEYVHFHVTQVESKAPHTMTGPFDVGLDPSPPADPIH